MIKREVEARIKLLTVAEKIDPKAEVATAHGHFLSTNKQPFLYQSMFNFNF